MQDVQNETLSYNKIKQIVRRAQQHCYKNGATNIESGIPLVLAFDKGERVGLGPFVKEATMFDHYVDEIISIRLNTDGKKGKNREAAEAIDVTIYDVDIYRKYSKRSNLVGHCKNYGGGGFTKDAAAGLSDIRRQ